MIWDDLKPDITIRRITGFIVEPEVALSCAAPWRKQEEQLADMCLNG